MSKAKSRSTISFNPLDDLDPVQEQTEQIPKTQKDPSVKLKAKSSIKKPAITKNKVKPEIKIPEVLQPESQASESVQSMAESEQSRSEPVQSTSESAQSALSDSETIRLPKGKRYMVRIRNGAAIADTLIFQRVKTGEWGYNEPGGHFVSLMHLDGPVTTPLKSPVRFETTGLAGSLLAGPLGLLAASILSLGKQSIFKARQHQGSDRYVSLNHESQRFLNSVIFEQDL